MSTSMTMKKKSGSIGLVMPIYKLRNTQTNEEWEEFMTISEMEQKLEEHPHVELLINGAPMVTGTMGKNTPARKSKK